MDGNLYGQKSETILIFSSYNKNFAREVIDAIKPELSAAEVHSVYPRFEPANIAKHKAAVMLPHSVMSYMTTELYALGMPLFVPSMKYWKKIGGIGEDRTIVGSPYGCGDTREFELTIANLTESSIHPYSPNVDFGIDPEAEMYWLQLADHFHWPHVQYFHDLNDLKYKLQQTNFDQVHSRMREEMRIKAQILESGFCTVVEQLHRKIFL